MLPAEYGCVNFRVALRPSNGLEWELVFEEQPLHSRELQFCKRRTIVSLVKLIIYTWYTLLIRILLMICVTIMIGGYMLSLSLKSSIGAGIGLFAFITIYPYLVIILLPLYSQRPKIA
jgi:hypothetical protein